MPAAGGHAGLRRDVGEGAVVSDVEGDDAVGSWRKHVEVLAVLAPREVERGDAVDRGRAQEGQLACGRDGEGGDGRTGAVGDERERLKPGELRAWDFADEYNAAAL